MPALSKKQQRFFGIVRAIQKGEQAPTTPETAKAAADMKKSDVKKFASTKHKGLPNKVVQKEGLDSNDKPFVKKLVGKLRKGSKTHAKQADDLEKAMKEESNPRIPRKKGQPAGSKKHSDLYTDENPKGTIHGLGFKDVATAKASVSKIRNSSRSHAHKIQAAVAMEQRAREMGKTSEAAVYRKYINSMKKKTKKMNEEKHGDHEPEMIRSQLKTAGRASKRIEKHSRKKDNFKAWVQSKITKASDYLDTAADYLDSKDMKKEAANPAQQAAIAINMKKKGKKPKDMSEGSLRQWFKGSKSKDGKGGWVNVVTGGTCASDEPGEGTPKCVSSSKRASMTKAERLSASRRKKKADPNQQSKSGAAKPTYVATDKKEEVEVDECWKTHKKVGMKMKGGKLVNDCRPKTASDYKKEEVIPEAKVDTGKSDAAKTNERNQRTFGNRRGSRGSLASHDDTEARRYNTKKGRGVKMKGKKDKTPVNYHKKDSEARVDALLKSMKEAVYTGPNKDDRKLIKKMDDPSYAKKLADYEKNMDPKKRQALKDKATKGMKFTHEEVVSEEDKKGKGSGKKDACYHKVKASASVWPSAYASGRLVQCRKKGAANYGNSKKESYSWRDDFDYVEEGAAWTKKAGKNPEGGLNEKGRKSYERENPGSNLKAPQPEGGSRKKSFCARMGGMKKKLTSSKTANDPNSRINKALRKWKC